MAKRWISPTKAQENERRSVAERLAEADFCLPGSVAVRSYQCGKDNCVCHSSRKRLHGPYIQWTRSVEGHTAHRRLSEEQYADYGPLFEEDRRLKALVQRLEALTLHIVERDDRRPAR